MKLVEVAAICNYADANWQEPGTKWSGLFETPDDALEFLIKKSCPEDFLSIDRVLIHWVKVGKPNYSVPIHSCEVEHDRKEDAVYFNEWDQKYDKYIRLFSCRK